MGLDMYLRAEKFVSGYDFAGETETFNKVIDAVEAGDIASKDSPSVTISVNVMYWRKQNAIHKWFVDNVQEGEDDCGDYYVSRANLIALKETCRAVLDNRSLAMKLLPPQEGFFFGGTELDEWYWEGVKTTFDGLEALLERVPDTGSISDWGFEYHSSW
jgi:hypothetical protein